MKAFSFLVASVAQKLHSLSCCFDSSFDFSLLNTFCYSRPRAPFAYYFNLSGDSSGISEQDMFGISKYFMASPLFMFISF